MRHEIEMLQHKLHRNYVTTKTGVASFEDDHHIRIDFENGDTEIIETGNILIATRSRPAQPPNVSFYTVNVVDSDHILQMETLLRNLVVVGAGVIGMEYASMLNALDIDVTVVDGRTEILSFLGREIVGEFIHHLRYRGNKLRLGETVDTIENIEANNVVVHLASGKRIKADMVLFAAGRLSNTEDLCVDKAAIEPDERGRIAVDEHYRKVQHIYAAGDVIEFPALASTSMEQRRHAASHAFDGPLLDIREDLFPFGIYVVPEMSVVGKTEEELCAANVPHESGIARFRKTSRGQSLVCAKACSKCCLNLKRASYLGCTLLAKVRRN